jgi:pyruvate dehydrogenase E2 component (dihydrolipoamide acetyltransferase)
LQKLKPIKQQWNLNLSMKVHFTYRIPAGETAPVDSLLAIIGKEGEDISALLGKTSRGNSSCRHSKTYFRGSSCSRNYKESSSVATSLPKG